MVIYIRDYYKILGIRRNADKKTIKKAYKKAIHKYNPDINKSRNAEKKFNLIKEAYIVLSDDKKRSNYDKLMNKALTKKARSKNKNNKSNIKSTVKIAKDVNDSYSTISKIINFGSGAAKGHSLMTGSNLLVGGALAGYGVKKGRDYMRNRGQNNNK